MIHLRSIRHEAAGDASGFPHDLPIVCALDELEFVEPVTFLVGENGCGKSTLLEALACAIESVAVGSEDLARDPSLAAVRSLAGRLRPTWSRRTRRGFFLRAEDFFGYAKRVAQLAVEATAEIEAVERQWQGRSEYSKRLAQGPHRKELGALRGRYGDGLDAQSHGESFLKLFQTRVVPDGLYLLDEPEAPLSPLRQLALLSLLKERVESGCQFVIATHSPILSCDSTPIAAVAYDDLEHVQLTRDFLAAPERFLRRL